MVVKIQFSSTQWKRIIVYPMRIECTHYRSKRRRLVFFVPFKLTYIHMHTFFFFFHHFSLLTFSFAHSLANALEANSKYWIHTTITNSSTKLYLFHTTQTIYLSTLYSIDNLFKWLFIYAKKKYIFQATWIIYFYISHKTSLISQRWR